MQAMGGERKGNVDLLQGSILFSHTVCITCFSQFQRITVKTSFTFRFVYSFIQRLSKIRRYKKKSAWEERKKT